MTLARRTLIAGIIAHAAAPVFVPFASLMRPRKIIVPQLGILDAGDFTASALLWPGVGKWVLALYTSDGKPIATMDGDTSLVEPTFEEYLRVEVSRDSFTLHYD